MAKRDIPDVMTFMTQAKKPLAATEEQEGSKENYRNEGNNVKTRNNYKTLATTQLTLLHACCI